MSQTIEEYAEELPTNEQQKRTVEKGEKEKHSQTHAPSSSYSQYKQWISSFTNDD